MTGEVSIHHTAAYAEERESRQDVGLFSTIQHTWHARCCQNPSVLFMLRLSGSGSGSGSIGDLIPPF